MRMNSGAATSGNEFIACAIFCGTIDGDNPLKMTKASAANPIDAKSGMPIRMAMSQTPTISSIRWIIRPEPRHLHPAHPAGASVAAPVISHQRPATR